MFNNLKVLLYNVTLLMLFLVLLLINTTMVLYSNIMLHTSYNFYNVYFFSLNINVCTILYKNFFYILHLISLHIFVPFHYQEDTTFLY